MPSQVRLFVGVKRIDQKSLYRVVGFAIDAGEVDFTEDEARTATACCMGQDIAVPPGGQFWLATPVALGGTE